MSDTNNPSGGNGAPVPTPPQPQQQLIINVQYLKDFSFENPRAPQSLMPQQTGPEIKLDINVNAQNMAPDTFEVLLSISARATRKDEPVFLVELTYAGVVTLQNVTREQAPFFILVETPRLLFPFARAIVADATRDGGFPPLYVHPIDFGELLRRQQLAQGQPPAGTA